MSSPVVQREQPHRQAHGDTSRRCVHVLALDVEADAPLPHDERDVDDIRGGGAARGSVGAVGKERSAPQACSVRERGAGGVGAIDRFGSGGGSSCQ